MASKSRGIEATSRLRSQRLFVLSRNQRFKVTGFLVRWFPRQNMVQRCSQRINIGRNTHVGAIQHDFRSRVGRGSQQDSAFRFVLTDFTIFGQTKIHESGDRRELYRFNFQLRKFFRRYI